MNEEIFSRLRKKGWSNEDIYKAVAIIERSKSKKTKKIRFMDEMVYWLILAVALLGNFIISVTLIPFILALKGASLYLVLLVIGFAFGAFFDLLIRDIEGLTEKDLVIAGIFLPVISLINIVVMVNISNVYAEKVLLSPATYQSPILIGVVYVTAFMFPYLIKTSVLMKEKSPDLVRSL